MKLAHLASLASAALPGSLATALASRQTCTNAQSRLCWDGTYDINTNWYEEGPTTGVTRVFNWEVTNTTLAPDGFQRQVLVINGQIPGPTLYADWGDEIEVHLTNSMQHNGTSIHWHGIRQFGNSMNDGANGVTECPLAPGDTKIYKFKATQYGTSWYHSHYSAQYGDGVFGAIHINGPATAEYDVDLGTITLSEWFHQTAFQAAYSAERTGPPVAQNFLINGTNALTTDPTQGTRFVQTFQPGLKYRLRFVNTAMDQFFRVSLDDHTMTVIAADLVPIQPYNTTWVGIAIGQRYEVIIQANQPTASYWLRVQTQTSCSSNSNLGSVTGYITYANYTALPTTTMATYTDSCNDETSLVPYVALDADQSGFPANSTNIPVGAPARVTVDGSSVFRWTINGQTMSIDFGYPSLQRVADGNTTWPATENPIFFSEDNDWVYWIIQNGAGVAHPIHLHGHDFSIISQGAGAFNASTQTLTWTNPPRRDVAMLPANGHLFLAFKADNPGIWLLHCHIAFHVAEGLSLQLVERQSEIFTNMPLTPEWEQTCTNWDTFAASDAFPGKTDSGL